MRRDGLWIRGLAAMAVLACAAAWGQEAGPPASQPGIQVDRKEGVPETVLKKIGERATGKTQEDLDAQKRALEARQRASAEEAVRRAEEKLTRAEEQQHARKLQEALRGKAAGAAGEGAERASGGKGGVEQAKAEVAERKSDVKTMDADAARTARNERIAKGVSWAGRTLAVYDAYQEEKAAAKKEHRTFSQANLTLNVAMNLSGITGAVGAFRATTRASDDMLKENLKRYAAAGYDINDPRVQAKAAMRAIAYGTVIGTYNGAKCLPVLGDMIAVGELTDASVGLVYDTVGARQTERANHETRTETFTSAVAVGRDQAAKLAKSTGAARLKIAAMGAMETELKDIEREVGALRDQYVKDYQTIETYNEKPAQEAPGAGTAGGADISPAAVRKLAEEVKAVTAAAQESTASAQRVTGEQERGQLKPEALARQYKLIVDRLAETEGKYKAVGGTYRQMTAALPGTDGADAAVDIESVRRHALDTLATIRSRTDVAQSVVDRYCRTADELTSLIGPHEEFQNAFSRGIDYFRDNGDFKPGSNDYADLTEIRDRVMSECRLDAGEISQRVGRAKELRAQADRLGREGQGDVPAIKKPAVAAAAGSEPAGEGVRKLAPAVTKMDDAVKTARDAVAKLGDLAGRLAPVRRDIASTLPPRVQRNPLPDEQMDTISLKQLRELTGLEGHGSQDDPHPELFGYTWHHYDSERNKQAGDPNSTPVPYMNGYCRLAEKGTVRVWIDSNQNGKQDKGEDLRVYPYWIWYTFWGSASDCYWYGRNRQGKNVRTLVSLADWQKHMDRVEPLNVPRADFAVLGTSVNRFSNPQSSGTVTRMQGFAGAGAITVEVCVNVNFQVGWTYLPTETRYNNEKRWLYFEDESAVDRNVSFWMTGREPHIREILYQATTVAADFEEHSRDHYVYDAQPLLPTLEGFTAKGTEYDKNNGIHTNPYRNFERKGSFQYSMGKTVCTAQWGERYYVGVSIEGVDGSRSWRQVMESLYQRCQTPSLPKSTAFTPAVPGAGKIVGVRTAYGSHIGSGARAVLRHTVDERVLFVKRNVRVQVDGYGYSLAQPHLLTAQLAQSVAAAIDRQPK